MKKLTILTVIFTLLLSPIFMNKTYASEWPTYKTEVKVKLLPTPTFSTTINGAYVFVNLETNEKIDLKQGDVISFKTENNGITATMAGVNFISKTGFHLREAAINPNNFVRVSSIQQSTGNVAIEYRGSFSLKFENNGITLFNHLDMEDYLKGVVPSEMPALWSIEAVKAQAVASRSYAYNQLQKRDFLEMTVSSQVYKGKSVEHPQSNKAIEETAGMYAVSGNQVIEAVFHSSSGGAVENSEHVWTSTVSYLRGKADPFDKHPLNPNNQWVRSIPTNTIKTSLRLADTESLLGLRITEKTAGGLVQKMEATVYNQTTKTVSSKNISAATGDRYRSHFGSSLNSAKFNVVGNNTVTVVQADGTMKKVNYLQGQTIKRASGADEVISTQNYSIRNKSGAILFPTAPTQFTFTGNGWGHGLGMSQWGARGMAEAGRSYIDIIKFYYNGVEVKPL